MPRVALLDVNVLVALFDPDHVHHDLAHDWFADHRGAGWATSPLTENGFVRVLSNPVYATPPHRPTELVDRLRRLRASGGHQFWNDDVSLCDPDVFDVRLVGASKQVTDVYLLAVAVRRKGRLATFDRHIPAGAVRGAGRDSLLVIGPPRD
jgi:toxin-antitoxin system PIN domain toxin